MGQGKLSRYASKKAAQKRDADAQTAQDRKKGIRPTLEDRGIFRPYTPRETFSEAVAKRQALEQAAQQAQSKNIRTATSFDTVAKPTIKKASFELITPAFYGLEGESITILGQELSVPPYSNKHSTFLLLRNTNNGWEIQRHVGQNGASSDVTTFHAPLDAGDKDTAIMELASWIREQEARNQGKGMHHLLNYPLAQKVNASSDGFIKPPRVISDTAQGHQPASGHAEGSFNNAVKDKAPVLRGYKYDPSKRAMDIVTFPYIGAGEQKIELLGNVFEPVEDKKLQDLPYYLMAERSNETAWHISRRGPYPAETVSFYADNVTEEQVVTALANWSRQQKSYFRADIPSHIYDTTQLVTPQSILQFYKLTDAGLTKAAGLDEYTIL